MLGEDLINSKICVINIGYKGEWRMSGSNLLHSKIIEEKYLFLKELRLTYVKATFLEFRKEYVVDGLKKELIELIELIGDEFSFLINL